MRTTFNDIMYPRVPPIKMPRVELRSRVSFRYATIEVEHSYPRVFGLDQTQLSDAVLSMIAHLHYILKLQKNSFTLELTDDDYLWTATLEINEEPKDQLFEILIPPVI